MLHNKIQRQGRTSRRKGSRKIVINLLTSVVNSRVKFHHQLGMAWPSSKALFSRINQSQCHPGILEA